MSGHPGGHPGGGHPGEHPHPHAVFHRQYEAGAPWDIGRPQPAYVEVEQAGGLPRRVLEIGCGTGALTNYLARQGHASVGIDVVERAIDTARATARDAGVEAGFAVADALEAADDDFIDLGQPFQAVVDVGFFHALSDEDRPRLLAALEVLLDEGGTYRFLCFSDKVPGAWGPRRITEAEIHETFGHPGWRVVEVKESFLETARPEMPKVDAWLATIERVG